MYKRQIIEELGLVGGIVVVFLYVCLLVRVGRIAKKCDRTFPAFLITGIALLLVTQALFNMMVAVGLAPVTGQPLPLISKGGTSTFINCAYIGMILSVSRYTSQSNSTPLSTGKGVRLIISGGGTGGHIFPAISIANAIKELCPDAEILFVGAEGRMEMQRVPDAGYRIIGLPVAGFDRKHLWKNVSVLLKLIRSQWKARSIIKEFRPQVAVGVGAVSYTHLTLPTKA